MNKTGGGVGLEVKLNTYEEKVLAILGRTFAEGVGSAECGVGIVHESCILNN